MAFHEHLSHWAGFYTMIATAGVTLAGLTFVAITSAERLVQGRYSVANIRQRIDPSLLAFTLALLLGCVMLVPTLTPLALTALLAGCGAFFFGYYLMILGQFDWERGRKYFDALDWLFSLVLPMLTALLLLLAGTLCWRGEVEAGLTVTCAAVLSLLLVGLRNTLDLLMSTMYYTARQSRQAEVSAEQAGTKEKS